METPHRQATSFDFIEGIERFERGRMEPAEVQMMFQWLWDHPEALRMLDSRHVQRARALAAEGLIVRGRH